MMQPERDERVDETRPEADATSEEAALWAAFSCAETEAAAAAAWVALQARRLPLKTCAVLRHRTGDDALEIVAVWPDHLTLPGELSLSAREAVRQGVPLVRSAPRGFHLAYALNDGLRWVVVAEVAAMPAPALSAALHALRWGAGWLVAFHASRALRAVRAQADRLQIAVRLSGEIARRRDARAAASALAEGLAEAFGATYAAVGLLRRGALSEPVQWAAAGNPHPVPDQDIAADFLLRALEAGAPVPIEGSVAASREAPGGGREPGSPPGGEPQESGARAGPGTPVPAACGLALPLVGPDAVTGAVYVQRGADAPWSPDEVAAIEAIAHQVAPLVQGKPLGRVAPVTRERRLFVALFGPVRLRLKLAIVSVLAAALVAIGATGRYAVPAEGVVEGAAPKTVVTPFDGTLSEVYVRRGDAVRRGQIVARMDDTQLLIERSRLAAERDQVLMALRAANFDDDPDAAQRLQRRLMELEAAQGRLETRLKQVRIVSPVDGIVVSDFGAIRVNGAVAGDELLIEVAPAQNYRLVLWVDQKEVAQIREGQSGTLAVPDERQPVAFTIKRLTDTVVPRDGRRRVRVDAEIEGGIGAHVRPGATGDAQVDVGNRKLIWIWWRRLEAFLDELRH